MSTHETIPVQAADPRGMLARIADGDARALRALFNERGGMAMAVALRILGDRREAELVVRETFLEVIRGAHQHAVRGTCLSTWVAALAHDRARDRLLARGDAAPDNALPEPAEPLPLESVVRRTERKRVAGALACLTPPQRQVLEMAWYDCMTIQGIAVRIGETEQAVAMRMSAGLARLAAVLPQDTEKSA